MHSVAIGFCSKPLSLVAVPIKRSRQNVPTTYSKAGCMPLKERDEKSLFIYIKDFKECFLGVLKSFFYGFDTISLILIPKLSSATTTSPRATNF